MTSLDIGLGYISHMLQFFLIQYDTKCYQCLYAKIQKIYKFVIYTLKFPVLNLQVIVTCFIIKQKDFIHVHIFAEKKPWKILYQLFFFFFSYKKYWGLFWYTCKTVWFFLFLLKHTYGHLTWWCKKIISFRCVGNEYSNVTIFFLHLIVIINYTIYVVKFTLFIYFFLRCMITNFES